jgi:cbb3-type cytochrome oxidase subunit 3
MDGETFAGLVLLILILGAIIYRVFEKEDKYEDKEH